MGKLIYHGETIISPRYRLVRMVCCRKGETGRTESYVAVTDVLDIEESIWSPRLAVSCLISSDIIATL